MLIGQLNIVQFFLLIITWVLFLVLVGDYDFISLVILTVLEFLEFWEDIAVDSDDPFLWCCATFIWLKFFSFTSMFMTLLIFGDTIFLICIPFLLFLTSSFAYSKHTFYLILSFSCWKDIGIAILCSK